MVARGVQGNPWLFSQIKEYLNTGIKTEKPSVSEAVEMMLRHARLAIEYKGEYIGIREMRKHVAWYTTGYPLAAKLRQHVNEISGYNELEELLMKYLQEITKLSGNSN
jgi:tRNA-dihydrouridine synthase